MKVLKNYIFITLYFTCIINSFAVNQSGQKNYDVHYYAIDVIIEPDSKSIKASAICAANIMSNIDTFVLDLTQKLSIDSILLTVNSSDFIKVSFIHENDVVMIPLSRTVEQGESITTVVYYGGAPKEAVSAPWDNGFVWSTSEDGTPWIGVACEGDGADIWWPCNDHPSDEPDSMDIKFTVPDPLFCASNGILVGEIKNNNNTSTYSWKVTSPINIYNVTFYAANYKLIQDEYASVSGKTIPFYFWILPEYFEAALLYQDTFKKEFDFLESICGPYPFGHDKHGWAYSPYWGMEHQSIIAYGHDFTLNNWGYDYIHYHELAHEWWGNHVTAKSWSDVWIHEGIATYTEALYVEHLLGFEAYIDFMHNIQPLNFHSYALAPREEFSANEAFGMLNSYYRGASVMHTLRSHLGDKLFFEVLKRWAYPNANDLDNTNGRQCRIVSTDDLINQAEDVCGFNLDAFTEVFFREASYPELIVERTTDSAFFYWNTETNVKLDVNVPITISGNSVDVEMNKGKGSIDIQSNEQLEIDPQNWLLMADPLITGIIQEKAYGIVLKQNYPNPFVNKTIIEFQITRSEHVSLNLYNISGIKIKELVNAKIQRGKHAYELINNDLLPGIYYYTLKSYDNAITKSCIIY